MTKPELGARFRSLKPSATVEMSERVRAAKQQGRDVIGLASGDPNVPTDERIVEEAYRSLKSGATHYTSSLGELALREAVARRELQRAAASYDPADVIITPGGKFAVLAALMALVDAGDEVLIPQPGWVSYGPCVRLCGGVPIAVNMLERFDMAALERACTGRTRAVIVNSPVNPTGRVLTRDEIDALVAMAESRNIWIIFDQVYADLTYNGSITFPQAVPTGHERTLVVDSLSKSFGMTGWRLGYLAMPPGIVSSVVKFIQHSIYCVPPFIQAAGVRALELSDELQPRYRAHFRKRVLRAAEALDKVAGIDCAIPEAGFFLFPRVEGDETQIARRWLDELDIAVLPGTAFGEAGAGHLRISLSCSDADIDRALDRIAHAEALA